MLGSGANIFVSQIIVQGRCEQLLNESIYRLHQKSHLIHLAHRNHTCYHVKQMYYLLLHFRPNI